MTDLPKLAAPARRVLAAAGVVDLESLSAWPELALAELHGIGPNTVTTLRDALAAAGLGFAPRQTGGISFADIVEITARWPGVTVGTSSSGSDSLLVGGRSFCRTWRDSEHRRYGIHDSEVLVVVCELDLKDQLIGGSGGVLFTTPHYDGYGAVLVRLADVAEAALTELLEDAYDLASGPQGG